MNSRALAVASAAIVLVACSRISCARRADIPFEKYGSHYSTKVDFARLENRLPLTRAHLLELTPANLEKMTQEELDQVYARLTAGPIPDGAFDGTFFFAKGGGLARSAEVIGGLKGGVVGAKLQLLEAIGQGLWKGKVFYRQQRVLRNMVRDRASVDLLLRQLKVDSNKLQQTQVGGKDAYLLFPARLYCGQSLLDSRRESIIIDYNFNDEIEGYQEGIDNLVGRNGTQIRDEIRMVRPGFYLGRAYLARVFALNFTLLNPEIEGRQRDAFLADGRIEEDCRVGPSRVIASN